MKTVSLIDKAFFLKSTLLFRSLDLDLLLAIADKSTILQPAASTEIFSPGQEGSRMYLLVKGTVQILDATRNPIALIEAGDFFGDESVFNDKPRGYYAVSHTDTQLLALSRTHLLTIITECPSLALSLLQVYSAPTAFRQREEAL